MSGQSVRRAYLIIILNCLAFFGTGLVFPFTAIYLVDLPGGGPVVAALYFAGAGAANLTVAVLLATMPKMLSDYALATLGTSLSVVGYLALSMAGNGQVVLTAALATGSGQGCLLAAIIPIISGLVPAEYRRQIFARRYQYQNVTLALGALAAGGIASLGGRSMLSLLFIGQAVAYLPLVAILAFHAVTERRAARPLTSQGGRPRVARGASLRPLAGMMGAAALFQLGASLFGFSQFEATTPLVADRLMSTGLLVISAMLAINVAMICLAQGRTTRWLSNREETYGLRMAMVFWIAGFLVAAATSLAPRPAQLVGLFAFASLFAVGECAYSCSFHPWLIKLAPENDLTRAVALVNSMMGLGIFLGPSLGIALVGWGHAPIVWMALAAGCCLVMLPVGGQQWLKQLIRPAVITMPVK